MKSTQLLFLLFISVVAWAGGPAKSNFTAMEVNHIRVNTPGLFNERKSFSIHLDSIKENEYCFPLPGGKSDFCIRSSPGAQWNGYKD